MISSSSSSIPTPEVPAFIAAHPTCAYLDREFEALVTAMAAACDVPIAMVTHVDGPRLVFRQQTGLGGAKSTPLQGSFCSRTLLADGIFEVKDVTQDARFADQPIVTSDPCIRFYAGIRLTMADGTHAGTVCVADCVPGMLTPAQRTLLKAVAVLAAGLIGTEHALRHAQLLATELRAVINLAPLGIYVCDALGAATFANARVLEILEATLEETIGNGWSRRIHPNDRADMISAWQASVTIGEAFAFEYRLMMPDGRSKLVRIRTRTVRDTDGRVASHIGTFEDMTEQREMELRLDAVRERLSTIIEATGGATFEWNVATGKMRLDARWTQLSGERLEAAGHQAFVDWAARIHPHDRPRLAVMHTLTAERSSGSFEIELRRQHADGHWMWFRHRGQAISWLPDGSPEWVLGIQEDVTDRWRLSEALHRTERLLAKAGSVAKVGGWDLDLLSGEITLTDETCRIHGLAPGHRPRLADAINFYAPASRPAIQAAMDTARLTGEGWDLELQVTRTDGSLIWVRVVGAAEYQNGRIVHLYGALQDISERIETQRLLREKHLRMALATDSGGIGVWEHDLVTESLVWDGRMLRLYGYPEDTGRTPSEIWAEALDQEDYRTVDVATARTLSTGERLDVEFSIHWPDGERRIIHSLGDVSSTTEGGRKLVGVNWDVTELRTLQDKLTEQHHMMQVTMRSIGDAVITTDRKACVLWLNPAAELMTGWTREAAIGRPIAEVLRILNEVTRQLVESPVAACLAKGETVALAASTILVSRDGREFGIEDSAAPIRDENGYVHGVVLVFHDVTTERRLKGELTYRATHDPLTGLSNRAEFEERLARVLDDSRQDGTVNALLFVDLDHFKLVNDAGGHAAGDEVLQDVARILREAVRAPDLVARVGGDEFAVILKHCPLTEATRIAQAICDRMEIYRYTRDGHRFRLGASIGIVPMDPRWMTVQDLVQAADGACAAAKEAGRNRVQAWTGSDHGMALRQTERQSERHWVRRLDRALEEDRFCLFVQPLRDLKSGTARRDGRAGLDVEVLLRLVGDEGTLILPGAFIPSAERFDLAPRIDLWVLDRVLAFLDEGPSLAALRTINVNLSGRSVSDRAFHADVVRRLEATRPEICERLCFEITETAAISNFNDATAFIDAVHRLGARVSLDDFGAGATSFGYLRAMKIDQLKIDGQFIQTLLTDPLSEATVRCFVEIAGLLGIPTVAEFVDDPDLIERLQALGVSQAQGYLIGRPSPIAVLRAVLDGRRESPKRMIEAWAS